MENPEPFISDPEYEIRIQMILKLVSSFYKEISMLICSYSYSRLQPGQVLDVCDERGVWIAGCVVAVRNNYVGIHYNGFGCKFDDWIAYQSFRLAPLHKFSLNAYQLSVYQTDTGRIIYNQFLSSISNGYRDRLCPEKLSGYINRCKEKKTSEILLKLEAYNRSLDRNFHDRLLDYRFNPVDYEPPCFLFDRQEIETKARKVWGR